MELDLKTMWFILLVIFNIQVFIFAYQYFANKEYKFALFWLYWSLCGSLSMLLVLSRSYEPLIKVIIILQNTLMVSGMIFLFIGTLLFLNIKPDYKKIIISMALYLSVLVYLTVFEDAGYFRSIVNNFYLAVYTFLPGFFLFRSRSGKLKTIRNILSYTFFIHTCTIILRLVFMANGSLSPFDMLQDHPVNIISFFDLTAVTIIWTFGYVMLVNEKISEQLRETKDRFELLFNTSPDDIAITRLSDGKIIDINEKFTEAYGYSKEFAVGKTTTEINIWADPSDRKKFVSSLKENGYCSNMETTLLSRDKKIIHGLVSARLIEIEGEECVLSTIRDLTEYKELQMQRIIDAENWEKTFDGISDCVFLLDTEARVIKYNSATEKILGKDDYIGKHCWEIVHKTDGHIENCPFVRMKKSLKRESMLLNVAEKWFEVTTDPIISDKNELTGAVHIITDITDRYRSEEELKRKAKELKEFNSLMIDRELKMVELKKEINELLKESGKPEKY